MNYLGFIRRQSAPKSAHGWVCSLHYCTGNRSRHCSGLGKSKEENSR
jgi:hypothetical protein